MSRINSVSSNPEQEQKIGEWMMDLEEIKNEVHKKHGKQNS